MKELTHRIKNELLRLGADIVGFGDLDELAAEVRGEFSFITHLIAEINGVQIGFCQFYDCWHSREYYLELR